MMEHFVIWIMGFLTGGILGALAIALAAISSHAERRADEDLPHPPGEPCSVCRQREEG